MQDVRRNNQNFYKEPDRQVQNTFLLKYVTVETPSRKRSRSNSFDKSVTTKYYLPKKREGRTVNVHVCKQMFLEVFQIGRSRLQNICKRFLMEGVLPKDKRGGDTTSEKFVERKQSVKSFIERFQPIQSHYTRSKTVTKQYLPSSLSITAMWQQYHEVHEKELHVTYEYFRSIFVNDYNISFATPATDCCSTCLRLKEVIKNCTDHQKIGDLRTELKVHEMRANAFYGLLKTTEEGILTLSYDCQKNLVLPKVQDQAAYYARQLYLYNYTICQGSSHDSQSVHNTFCYLWTEDSFRKGSNEIASALYHRLQNTDLADVHCIRLFADGCGGQNKNKNVVGMLCKWLAQDAPRSLKTVLLVFPIVGHSFIPPDRVFGKIERALKKIPEIVDPMEYESVISKFGSVIHLGETCSVYDWKSAAEDVLKPPSSWHFQFQKSKRMILTRSKNGNVVVQGEPHFRIEVGEPKSIVRRGKHVKHLKPTTIAKGVQIGRPKLDDVRRLLTTHYGEQWESVEKLRYYKTVLQGSEDAEVANDSDFDVLPEEDDAIQI